LKIDKAICLTLDKRYEMASKLDEQVRQHLNTPFEMFLCGEGEAKTLYNFIDKDLYPGSQWQYGNGQGAIHHYRAHLAHKKIIKRAKHEELSNFLLLEDDAVLLNRQTLLKEGCWWDSVIEDEIYSLEDFDLLYLGWHCFEFNGDIAIGYNEEIEASYIEKGWCWLECPQNIGGFHAVVINHTAYDKLLELPIAAPIDHLVNLNREKFNRRIFVPKIFHTKDSFSYCEQRMVIREELK
jgi:hypothetical protein